MSAWSERQCLVCVISCLLLSIAAAANSPKMNQQEAATWSGRMGRNSAARRLHTQLLYDAYRDRLRAEEEVREEEGKDAAMDEQSLEHSWKYFDRVSKEDREEAAAEKKKPPVSGMLILKMNNEPAAINSTAKATHQQEEENRVKALQLQPVAVATSRPIPKLSSEKLSTSLGETLTKSGSLGLSAVTRLMDALEQLEQNDLVSELAKRIGAGMETKLSSNSSLLLGLATSEQTLNELLDDVDPQRVATHFKNVLKDLKKRRPVDQLGGLYDDYLQIFNQALSGQKFARASTSKGEGPEQTRKYVKLQKPPAGETKYANALETFLKMSKENQLNGGLKPYYLPKSKNRQLIWNEVPLIKPEHSAEPQKLKAESMRRLHDVKKKLKLLDSDERDSKMKLKTQPGTAEVESAPALDANVIINGLKAIKKAPFYNLFVEYQRQMLNLKQSLQCKQDWWKNVMDKGAEFASAMSKRNVPNYLYPLPAPGVPSAPAVPAPVPFPEALMKQAGSMPQIGGNVMDNMASQMNISPLELAQRLVGSSPRPIATATERMPTEYGPVQGPLVGQLMSVPLNTVRKTQQFVPQTSVQPPQMKENIIAEPTTLEPPVQDQPAQEPSKNVSSKHESTLGQESSNIAPVLDKILQRLETIQELKCNSSTFKVDEKEELPDLPCCFADADAAPCDINGSWESHYTGVRINIRTPKKGKQREGESKPTCYNPKGDKSRRQCVKMNQSQLKDKSDAKKEEQLHGGLTLNVSVQEIVPPRTHAIFENLTEWDVSGQSLSELGGPISLAFRKVKSNQIVNFVGYCRNCGCVDTIFGSWTFCQPSRDCQDITMSITDKRDLLRRYNLDEKRRNRYKEQLYLGSKFARLEKERMEAELMKFERSTLPPQLQQN
ncbi:uncharacterized protein LOC117585390 [Drosophila guanche]|uniref:Uncharacterized protein n=1 Tax=Drosophila guanche TaxID=7266 RepID=A0A3B0KA33_DROGU|nr:uncharacterized protein LOC117585390 [Drosophila guanche]SPP82939.1 Hypothetical predicted protein [Drosophila guanche]